MAKQVTFGMKKKRLTAAQKKKAKAKKVKDDLALLAQIQRKFPAPLRVLIGIIYGGGPTGLLARIESAIDHERGMRRKAEQRVAVLEALIRRGLLGVTTPPTPAKADEAMRYVVDGVVHSNDEDDD